MSLSADEKKTENKEIVLKLTHSNITTVTLGLFSYKTILSVLYGALSTITLVIEECCFVSEFVLTNELHLDIYKKIK